MFIRNRCTGISHTPTLQLKSLFFFIYFRAPLSNVRRSKNSGDKENLKNSKYLSLSGPSSRPLSHSNLLGEMKGVVTKVIMNDKGTVMTLHTASEEFLEIKVRVMMPLHKLISQ